jgi:gluconate 2-dehydrogenase alpha chain
VKRMGKVDVAIIGLGAAGGIASYVLTAAGLDVVGIEAGPYYTLANFARQLDEIGGGSIRNQLGAAKFNQEIPTWRPDARSATRPVGDAIPMNNGVGGSSIHYGTQSWRYLPENFRVRSHNLERYGPSVLPPGSAVVDWPITYDDLEPYYDKVEYLIGVSGKAGANPFEAHRSRGYPLPPLRSFGYGEMAARTFRDMGYHPFPQPAAILSHAYHDRPGCTYCGFCSGFGCWNNSKSSTLVSAIQEAEKTGRLTIRANSRVIRITSDRGGNATGVEYLDPSGSVVFQPARFVILSSFVYENTRLLLLSRGDAFPHGLSNNHGQVGRYYMSHSYVGVNGLFPGRRLNLFNGATGQAVCIDDLDADNFDHSGLGFIQGSVIFAGNGNLPIAASGSLAPGVPAWGSAYKAWLHTNANSVGGIFAQQETLPYDANFLDLDPHVKDPAGVPVVRVTYSWGENERKAGAYMYARLTRMAREMGATEVWPSFPPLPLALNSHCYGGTRMGDDPGHSVVDGYSLSHEVHNLAIMGGSTFCNTTGYNPTETIEAIAWRSAEHIAENFAQLGA